MFQDREERQKVDISCELAGLGGAAEGQIRDLSVGGCRLLTPHFGFGGERLMISLSLPSPRAEMHLVAETRWSDLSPTPSLYVLGCQFVHTDQSRKHVKDLLASMEGSRRPDVARQPDDDTKVHRIG